MPASRPIGRPRSAACSTRTLLRENWASTASSSPTRRRWPGSAPGATATRCCREVIASGCDVILFSDDPDARPAALSRPLADGRLSQERVDEAVTRVLALKAALGLHKPTAPSLARGGSRRSASAEKAAYRRPASPPGPRPWSRTPRTSCRSTRETTSGCWCSPAASSCPSCPIRCRSAVPERLEEEGFEVTVYTPGMAVSPEDFDLVLYLFAEETLLTRGRIFLDWPKLPARSSAHEPLLARPADADDLVRLPVLSSTTPRACRPMSTPTRRPRACSGGGRCLLGRTSSGTGTARSIRSRAGGGEVLRFFTCCVGRAGPTALRDRPPHRGER